MKPSIKIQGIDPGFFYPPDPDSKLVSQWAQAFPTNVLTPNIENSTAEISALISQSTIFPLLISSPETSPQTWISSQYTHFIRYAREEAGKIPNPLTRTLLQPVIYLFDKASKWAQIDHAVYLNNFGVSTNLWPNVPTDNLICATQQCAQVFPDKTIILKSLDTNTNPEHVDQLRKNGFLLVPSRVIYTLPVNPAPNTRDFRRDRKLFRDGQYTVRDGSTLSPNELTRCAELYSMLYIQKYSPYNPHYTTNYFLAVRDSGFLSFKILERHGTIDGVIGTYIRNGILTTPILGYDINKPRSYGLYRRLAMAIYYEAVAKGCTTINRSSGVGKFKKSRGAEAVTEFTAIYCKHRPPTTRIFWLFLKEICARFIVPMIKRLEL